jgi:hypothetical protein
MNALVVKNSHSVYLQDCDIHVYYVAKTACNTSLSKSRLYPLTKACLISSRERDLVGRKGIGVHEAYMTKSSSSECSCAHDPSLSSHWPQRIDVEHVEEA